MRALVYKLINPKLIYQYKDLIRKIIFPVGDSYFDSNRRFEVSEFTGFITYFDHNLLWNSKTEIGPLNSPESVKIFAEKFIHEFNEKMKKEEGLNKAGIPSLFSAKCQPNHLETVAVLHPDNGKIDHWLSRFEITLVWSEELKVPNRRATVLFSTIEIRTTFNGEIVGLNIRWRPANDKIISTPLLDPDHPHSENDQHGHEHNTPAIVYALDSVENPELKLAPYYLAGDGHHAGFIPASAYSMVIDLFQENLNTGANLYPVVKGGSGSYDFHWGKWQIDTVSDEGIKYLGRQNAISVDTGVYNVILDIEDTGTGQVKRFEKMIFANGIIEDESSTSEILV